jgi:glutathione peroxidase
MHLRRFQGHPLMIVNTASNCEFTRQYAKLGRVWEEYRQSGLSILAMPSDDFGGQEPGEEAEIAEFLETEFQIRFPVTARQHVMGREAHPLFRALREEYGDDVTPRWNFHKDLFNRHGDLVSSWPSRVEPDDSLITHQIERNLHSWIL